MVEVDFSSKERRELSGRRDVAFEEVYNHASLNWLRFV